MGEESIQIRKHIEQERAELDRCFDELDLRFKQTQDRLAHWLKSPLAFAVFTLGFAWAAFKASRRTVQEPHDIRDTRAM